MSREPYDIHAALAALADGTLPDEQQESVLARVGESPELAAELEDQRRAVLLVRSLEQAQAPGLLRRSIELAAGGELATVTAADHNVGGAAPAVRRRRPRPALLRPSRLGAALALGAAVAVVLVLVLTGGGGAAAPTVVQASRPGLLAATGGAPAESPDNHRQLTISAAGIAYPYWGGALGWSATGARTDSVGGRTVTTVFYTSHHGRRIGYSIVSGPALAVPAGSTVVQRHGISFHILAGDNPTILTWRQSGHTCILTAHGVGARSLTRLAARAQA